MLSRRPDKQGPGRNSVHFLLIRTVRQNNYCSYSELFLYVCYRAGCTAQVASWWRSSRQSTPEVAFREVATPTDDQQFALMRQLMMGHFVQ